MDIQELTKRFLKSIDTSIGDAIIYLQKKQGEMPVKNDSPIFNGISQYIDDEIGLFKGLQLNFSKSKKRCRLRVTIRPSGAV